MQEQIQQIDQNYMNRLNMLKQLKCTTSGFLRYSKSSSSWQPCSIFNTPKPYKQSTITTLSLNVLYDRLPQQQNNQRGNMEAVINSTDRYRHILDKLGEIMPCVIGLQEVTTRFYHMLLDCEWVKLKYWVADFKNYQHGWGNLILTRIQPICLQTIKVKSLPRIVCTAFLAIQHPETKEVSVVSFSTAHLIAYDKNHEIRVEQLNSLVNSLKRYEAVVSETVIQGDMNFHAEFQTESATLHKLTDTWLKKYNNNLKEHPGYTFDSQTNSMINQMYWGFERRQMRLDRIFYLNNTLQIEDVKIVFNQPALKQRQGTKVNKHMFLKGGLLYVTDYLGWNIRGKSKEDYLFASDHFGLLGTFKIKPKVTQITKLV